jgi:hypothetical protein
MYTHQISYTIKSSIDSRKNSFVNCLIKRFLIHNQWTILYSHFDSIIQKINLKILRQPEIRFINLNKKFISFINKNFLHLKNLNLIIFKIIINIFYDE